MNKKIKLSLLGTLIAGSALAVTLPIVSCSVSTDVAVTATPDVTLATAAMKEYVQGKNNLSAQNDIVTEGNIITDTNGTIFTKLVSAAAFVEKDTTTAAKDAVLSFEVTTGTTVTAGAPITGVILTVHLRDGYSTDAPIKIVLESLGNGFAEVVPPTAK